MTKRLAFLLVAAASATASAQNYVASDGGHASPPLPRALDARIGALLGAAVVGDTDNFAPGVSGGLGYRIGELELRGLFDYYRVGDDPSTTMARRGRAVRLGAAARTSFAHTDRTSSTNFDFWGEGGVGYEHIAWLPGGVLDRPDAELAVGLDGGWRGDKDRDGHRKTVGYFMDVRSMIAEGPPAPGAMPVCGGPCTQATTPPRVDVTMFFELGVFWGR